ncbi:tetratricopeptide repeat protein [Rhodanobacter denitrificans]|uniref:Tetratricopeptide repeat protein n=1 Tax=Rhodanobacter denitrificans TaxID=666685 RepID=A0A368KGA7_9GAMM|nr:tetratricopeptide repeat protein [Rhodanobacter denitrificans]RCS30944.1 tetratricopeptide repeat protein [Rhodanobacter denitrificans]
MKTVFFIAAAAMVAVALAVLLLPLMRQGRKSGRPRSVFVTSLLIALVLPLGAGALYLLVGTPAALNGVAAQPAAISLPQAIAELRTHLQQQPDDLQGWMLLAQTSSMLRQPAEARDAFDHALKLDPNNAEAMIGWAENDSMTRSDHLIEGRARELLERAVRLHPDSQRGLWLLGIGNFQRGEYREAAATWRLLLPQLEPGSSVAKAVAEQIAVADARSGGAPADPSSGAPAPAPQGAALQVQVTLAPALKDKLAPGDALFVYARAAGTPSEPGPPMPLAVARLDPARLPTTVTLNDAMAMTPAFKLSSVQQVFVGARISHSGQPIAQPGDLEGDAGVVAVDRTTPVEISIDKVH